MFICLAHNKETTTLSTSVFKIKVTVGVAVLAAIIAFPALTVEELKAKICSHRVRLMLRYDFVKQAGTGSTQEAKQAMRIFKSCAIFSLRELKVFHLNRI